jgi:hypothetical protein
MKTVSWLPMSPHRDTAVNMFRSPQTGPSPARDSFSPRPTGRAWPDNPALPDPHERKKRDGG